MPAACSHVRVALSHEGLWSSTSTVIHQWDVSRSCPFSLPRFSRVCDLPPPVSLPALSSRLRLENYVTLNDRRTCPNRLGMWDLFAVSGQTYFIWWVTLFYHFVVDSNLRSFSLFASCKWEVNDFHHLEYKMWLTRVDYFGAKWYKVVNVC